MTDMQQWQPATEVTIHDATDRAVHRLGEWAHSADAAYQISQRLVQTSFVPDAFRGKPAEATAAILAGIEVGLSPMAALRSFDVIQGQAAPRAITQRAIVQSQGHEIVVDESTPTKCRARGRRRGSSEWQTVTWTLERAKQLGLDQKPNWKKQPMAMLVARATSELARLIAADAILGIPYTVEELVDGAEFTPEPEPEPTPKRTVSRKKPEPPPAVEPDLDEPAPAEQVEGITPPQSKKLHALFNERGITERDDRLAYAAGIVDREIGSSNELSKDEASRVIDSLEQMGADEPTLDDAPSGWDK